MCTCCVAGDLVTRDKKKSKIINVFSALVLTGKICLQESQASDNSGKVWTYDDLPLVEEDQVKEYLNKLGIHHKIM